MRENANPVSKLSNGISKESPDPREPILTPSSALDSQKLIQIADSKHAEYQAATPFPHIAIDDLFDASWLQAAIDEVPFDTRKWDHYQRVNEKKRVCSDIAEFGPKTELLVYALNSAPFVRFLEKLTGITHLLPDPTLNAAGYMCSEAGGFLDLHTDFTMHWQYNLERQINVLIYLNKDWKPEWGGQLELHSSDSIEASNHTMVSIEPTFNRMLIFNTPNAVHGHPRIVKCPEGRARMCLSWFYYTPPTTLGEFGNRKPNKFHNANISFKKELVHAANMITPPILFRGMGALRKRLLGYRSNW